VHFTPRRHWINDPNGLVWHDGEYHLFYQHNPQGNTWGHMSWGHAVSTDLLQWQELPLAIAEDDAWMIFSGSVVIDHADTSGFGDGVHAPMVACYTGCRQGGGRQNQQLAFSLDCGRSWTKYAGNPVLDPGLADFRDPKVFWHAPTGRWLMLVSMAADNRVAFFGSSDLRHWEPLSEFTVELPGCRLWECPDLLHLSVHGEPGASAWLMKVDVFEGHPGGGSGAVAIVGEFDGTRFTATQAPQWLDGGMDFYAAIAFGAMPPGDGRSVWLGWMNDHHYAAATPTSPWRGAMTLPREVGLARRQGQLLVTQQPIAELKALRGRAVDVAGRVFAAGQTHVLVEAGVLPLAHDIEIEVASAGAWRVGVRAGENEVTVIGIDPQRNELFIDRSGSGVDVATGGYAVRRAIACMTTTPLRIVVDACSVEVFTGDGAAVLTELIFPRAESTAIWLACDAAAALQRFTAWPLANAMKHSD
jgi:fructan beta-fructosidase